MGSLRMVAWGLLVVAVDLNIDDLDLLADPIGWAMVLLAVLGLRPLHRAFAAAGGAAALGLVTSVPAWLGVDGLLLSLALGLAQVGVLFAVCTALMDLVPARRHLADRLRWCGVALPVVLGPVLLLVRADDGPGRVPLVVLAIVVAVALVVVFVWFLVLLFQSSRPPPGVPAPSLAS
jgi:hypothetical protein